MSVIYEVTAITGKYTDREGNEKKRYTKMGVVIDGKHGPMLKLEAIPFGFDGWAYLNEPRAKDAEPRRDTSQRQQLPEYVTDNDLPF